MTREDGHGMSASELLEELEALDHAPESWVACGRWLWKRNKMIKEAIRHLTWCDCEERDEERDAQG